MSKGRKPKAQVPLKALREMRGKSQASLACSYDEAARRVACGWQPMGQLGDSIILVADADAVREYERLGDINDHEEDQIEVGDDETQSNAETGHGDIR